MLMLLWVLGSVRPWLIRSSSFACVMALCLRFWIPWRPWAVTSALVDCGGRGPPIIDVVGSQTHKHVQTEI